MTYRRRHTTVEATLARALRGLSDVEIKEHLKRTRSFYQKSANPRNPQRLALEDAIAIDRIRLYKGDPPIFLSLFQDKVAEAELIYNIEAADRQDLIGRLQDCGLDVGRRAGALMGEISLVSRQLSQRRVPQIDASTDHIRDLIDALHLLASLIDQAPMLDRKRNMK